MAAQAVPRGWQKGRGGGGAGQGWTQPASALGGAASFPSQGRVQGPVDMSGVGKAAASLKCQPIPDPPASPSSHLVPFLPISPPYNSSAKSLPSWSSLAASVATGIYLPGSGITEERGGSRLREELGPGREDTPERRAGAGASGDRAKGGPRLAEQGAGAGERERSRSLAGRSRASPGPLGSAPQTG